MNPDKKIKMLVLADSPVSATGFAQVTKNILNKLASTGKYEIDIIGINHPGDSYDLGKYPYKIYQAMPPQSPAFADMYGRPRFLSALNGQQMKSGMQAPYDLVFTIQDSFIIEGMGINVPFGEQVRVTKETWKRSLTPDFWFKWIGYFPVDAEVKENWVTRSMALPDYPVAYCDYGKKEIMKYDRDKFELVYTVKQTNTMESKRSIIDVPSMKDRIGVIPHGVDLKSFYPISAEDRTKFRQEFFGGAVKEDTFLVVNISRNQPRKDVMRTLAVFSEFKKQVPNSHLYLHMQSNDVGGSIDEMARHYGLEPGKEYSVPVDFSSGMGYTLDIVNKIYNAADACVTTTLGEGWGFISTEAFAAKTPLVAPNITSFIDILGADVPMDTLNEWLENGGWDKTRGIPVLAGSNKTEWICLGLHDNERLRPLTNVDDMVKKLLWVRNNPEKVKEITQRAFEWVQELSWDKVTLKWDALFQEAYSSLLEERAFGDKIDKTNRNDPCPCGSGKKFKNCHASAEKLNKIKGYMR